MQKVWTQFPLTVNSIDYNCFNVVKKCVEKIEVVCL